MIGSPQKVGGCTPFPRREELRTAPDCNWSCPERLSRRRHGQKFLVLGAVFLVAHACGHQRQIVAHFVTRENLAELGDEQAGTQVAGEMAQRRARPRPGPPAPGSRKAVPGVPWPGAPE